MRRFARLAELADLVGEEIGVSEWITVDQVRIDQFAQATGDHQWIHVDPVRAAAGPFGSTIAHGYLTLALLPRIFETAVAIDDVRMGVNYGLNKVRFPAPVPAGSRLRGHLRLLAYDALPDGAQLTIEVTIERDGARRPVCVAQAVSRRYTST